MKPKNHESIQRIAFVGNYLPRQCGIATFTTDLTESVATQYPHGEYIVLAMNDKPGGHEYPARVRLGLAQDDRKAYEYAAEFLNLHNIDLVCLQHEFGIFGGKAGNYILDFLRSLQVPVVTTLHTILTNPDEDQRYVMDELVERSERLAVMSQRGKEFLQDIYGVRSEKIDLIQHGIPDVPFIDTNFFKDKFKVEGKRVLSTFGLLSENKGLEYVLEAMPAILEKYPDVIYIILGATHPHVKEQQGESYREYLAELAGELGIEKNVLFYNQFVTLEELTEFIGATDIYITPYLNEAQIVSGTLAYTAGAGKVVISTPYWYAEELLADGRGLIVPFRDSGAIAENVLHVFDNNQEGHAIRKRAYLYGRNMIWPEVAKNYMSSFSKALSWQNKVRQPSFQFQSDSSQTQADDLPPINMKHVLRMTDATGMLQHAVFSMPNYAEGYTTDDNARALILSLSLDELEGDSFSDIEVMTSRYLAFIWYAFDHEKNRFRNFLSFNRTWLEETGSEDSQGRALWGLGAVLGHADNEHLRGAAARLFEKAIGTSLELKSPRAWAFTLLGISKYLYRFPGDRPIIHTGQVLAERLMNLYTSIRGPNWHWFENVVTYNNATLPHALLLSSIFLERKDLLNVSLKSLQWLLDQQTSPQGAFIPIGNQGFYARDGKKARFDQQPLEASAMVSACMDAYRITGHQEWYRQGRNVFEWFLGRNDLGLSIYDPETGGCHDGVHPDRLNENQGAESTLSFLLALAEMYLIKSLTPLSKLPEKEYTPLILDKKSSIA